MPKIDATSGDGGAMNLQVGHFGFSAVRPERLGATEYTLASVVIDFSGSVQPFAAELQMMLKTVLEGFKGTPQKPNPRAANLLARVVLFSSQFDKGLREVHGFKTLKEIDPDQDYTLPRPYGNTPLYDATYEAVAATNEYARHLYDKDYTVNAIEVIITDGLDNASAYSPDKILVELQSGVTGEFLESNISILVALNAAHFETQLRQFHAAAGLDHYLDLSQATSSEIGKLAKFIIESVSSQSQSLGSGGPSQNIAATI